MSEDAQHRATEFLKGLPPVPGLPLIRLDVTTNIGKVRLRHPGPPGRKNRRRGAITR
jgi:hypothetical protein